MHPGPFGTMLNRRSNTQQSSIQDGRCVKYLMHVNFTRPPFSQRKISYGCWSFAKLCECVEVDRNSKKSHHARLEFSVEEWILSPGSVKTKSFARIISLKMRTDQGRFHCFVSFRPPFVEVFSLLRLSALCTLPFELLLVSSLSSVFFLS
jgi:hypothetical protein